MNSLRLAAALIGCALLALAPGGVTGLFARLLGQKLERFVEAEIARWGDVVTKAGIAGSQ